jgi:ascorbate-specific PTS system EIIC-type component UlaA
MKALFERVRREPAVVVGLVTAVLLLLTEFGVNITSGQQAAIVGVVIAIGAIIVRQSVTPNVSVGALTDNQENPGGDDLMAGQASDVPDGDPVDVVARNEERY